MSKRSSRLKKRKKEKQLSVNDIMNKGRSAFKLANYDDTVRYWKQIIGRPTAPNELPQFLAEAYFRQALQQTPPELSILLEAHQLMPEVPMYRYHVALAYHRQKDFASAEGHYRHLLDNHDFKRAAMPLAQLLVVQQKVISKDAVWTQLTPTEQQEITAIHAVVTNRAISSVHRLMETATGLHPLWYGLLAYKSGDKETAHAKFEAVASNDNEAVKGSANYLLGLLAIEKDDLQKAQGYWESAQAQGFNTTSLNNNLAQLYYRQAVTAVQKGQADQALTFINKAPRGFYFGKPYNDFIGHIRWLKGYQATQKGDWQTALQTWLELAQSEEKPSRRLVFNVALAYQNTEDYYEAAAAWRDVLRRRPRKSDHPDALQDDQVARIWQNVAENYSHFGDYDEAVKTYKNAVKWAPENLNLRLKLVEAYQTEGRWQAAENELNRILEKEPDNVQALLLLAETTSENSWRGEITARNLWKRVLEIEPQNPVARQQLADSYERSASTQLRYGNATGGIKICQEGLEQIPDSTNLHLLLGKAYISINNNDLARLSFNKALALAPQNLDILYNIYLSWMYRDSLSDIEETLEKILTLPNSTPHDFFTQLANASRKANYKSQAQRLIEYATTIYADDHSAIIYIAEYYSQEDDGQAVRLLKTVLDKDPENGLANLRLGAIYYQMGQTRLGKQYWKKAEQYAHKTNNKMLLYEIKTVKDYHIYGKRAPTTLSGFLKNMPPELVEELIKSAPAEIQAMYEQFGAGMFDMMGDLGIPDFDEDDFYD